MHILTQHTDVVPRFTCTCTHHLHQQVDGREARVLDYAPGQQLQPHTHDVDELFEIRGGAVLVSLWPQGATGPREECWKRAGDKLEVPKVR